MSRRHAQARFGGAERVRTAASQFCRLLPYHLGTAPRGRHYSRFFFWNTTQDQPNIQSIRNCIECFHGDAAGGVGRSDQLICNHALCPAGHARKAGKNFFRLRIWSTPVALSAEK